MNVGSLFSGAGLLDYGLTLAGFDHAWFCESDPFRRELLALRWPGVPIYEDVRGLGKSGVLPCDLIVGGFPCRGLSSAGKREGFGHPETALWREQSRIIRLLRPRYVLVENVAALLGFHGGECFNEVVSDLASSGYVGWWDVLPAAAVGAPHRRERVFVIAYAEPGRHSTEQPARNGGQGAVAVERSVASASDPARSRLEGAERLGLSGKGQRNRPELGSLADTSEGGRRAPVGAVRRGQPDAEGGPAAHPASEGGQGTRPEGQGLVGATANGREAFGWGDYEPAIRRWEALTRPAPEPLVRRVDDGTPPRVHRSRLSALGDGVQVQVAELLGRMILEHAAEVGAAS